MLPLDKGEVGYKMILTILLAVLGIILSVALFVAIVMFAGPVAAVLLIILGLVGLVLSMPFLVSWAVILLIMVTVIKLLIVPYFDKRKKSRLDLEHMLIIPQKQKVRVDMNNTVNGFNPYVIDCFYTDEKTGREFVFTSKPFLNDPTPYLEGVQLGVFVNPVDYSNYYVDVSKLGDIK